MTHLVMKADLRSTPGIGADHSALYRSFLDMCEWADGLRGTTTQVTISEHHCAPDGYMPSPIVTAAAALGRTKRLTVRMTLLLPLYDPIRLAEDLAVLDLTSGGRMSIVLGAGYRSEEFDMLGVDIEARGQLMEEYIGVLKLAWTGEPFEYRGRSALVLPRPFQRPRPPIVMAGSSPGSARRAARHADGYLPNHPDLLNVYREELERLGRAPGPIGAMKPCFKWVVAVANDPDATWEQVGPFCLHEMNSYAEWAVKAAAGANTAMYAYTADTDSLRERGPFDVLTPAQCVEWIRNNDGTLVISPLTGGLPPEVAWESLRLIESDVLPEV
ncbi:MAG: LLM class flavin-dependent oxidoreductase [Acidimicrobiia bacterium]